MPTFITHLLIQEKVYDQYFTGRNKLEFTLGHLLPDIRRLGVVRREDTHWPHITLAEVNAEPDSFKAGMMFHSLVDHSHKQIMRDTGVLGILNTRNPEGEFAFKVYEDTMLYSGGQDWAQYKILFEHPIDSERRLGIADDRLRWWHRSILEYIDHQPETRDIQKLCLHLQVPLAVADLVVADIDYMKSRDDYASAVRNILDHAAALLAAS